MVEEETKNNDEETKNNDSEQEIIDQNDSFGSEFVDRANAAADRLERANALLEKNLSRQEKINVEAMLSGKSSAGKEEKEVSPKEYAEKVLKGELDDE